MDLRNPGTLESFSSVKVPPSVSRPLKKFYQGEPLALGITQILISLLGIAFGTVIDLVEHDFTQEIGSFTPYWTGLLYIISGSLSVAAAKKPKIPLVKGALAMNIVSAVAAGIGLVIFSISMTFRRSPSRDDHCEYYHNETEAVRKCHELHTIPNVTKYIIAVFLLVLTILEFLITIVASAFGCASLCRNTYSETTVVIYETPKEASSPPLPAP